MCVCVFGCPKACITSLFTSDLVYPPSPHNAEDLRLLELSQLGIDELLQPVEAEPRRCLDPQCYFKYNGLSADASLYSSVEPMLSESKLNKRKTELDPSLSLDSILNTR